MKTKTITTGNTSYTLPIIGKGLKVTPISQEWDPFELIGDVVAKEIDGVMYYYCNGRSFAARICEVIE